MKIISVILACLFIKASWGQTAAITALRLPYEKAGSAIQPKALREVFAGRDLKLQYQAAINTYQVFVDSLHSSKLPALKKLAAKAGEFLFVYPFENKHAVAVGRDFSKFYLVDESYTRVKEIIGYEYVGPLRNGFIIVRNNLKNYGFILFPEFKPLSFVFSDGPPEVYSHQLTAGYHFGKLVYQTRTNRTFGLDGKAERFQGNAAVFFAEKGRGLINRNGQIVLPPVYTEIWPFKEGFAVIEKEKKFGLVYEDGKIIVPAIYGFIDNQANHGYVVATDFDGKRQAINTKGEKIAMPEYSYRREKGEGYLVEKTITENGKPVNRTALVDKNGKFIIPFRHRDIMPYKKNAYLAQNDSGRWYVCKPNGDPVSGKTYGNIFPSPDESYLQTHNSTYTSVLSGCLDSSGREIIPPLYYSAVVIGRIAIVRKNKSDSVWLFRDDGTALNSIIYDQVVCYSEVLAVAEKGRLDIFDTNTGEPLPCQGCTDVKVVYLDRARFFITKAGGKYRLCNNKLLPVLPFEFTHYEKEGDVLKITRNGISEYYDKNLDKTAKPFPPPVFNEGLTIVANDNKYGFADRHSRLVIACQYDAARSFFNNRAAVLLHGKWGFVDNTGKLIVPCQYEEVGDFCEGMAGYKINGKWGYLNYDGKPVTKAVYDFARDFNAGFGDVSYRGHGGWVNKKGDDGKISNENSSQSIRIDVLQ